MPSRFSVSRSGFTIVELLIVIVVIGILATITIVSYSGIQKRAASAAASSDLRNAATLMAAAYTESGSYPTTLPLAVKTSPNIILQLAGSSASSGMCINAHHASDSTLRMSWDSVSGAVQSQLCSGIPMGSSTGGSVPQTPRDTNVVADLSRWTLTGGATYNTSTQELTLTPSGVIRSPITRVDSPKTILIGGDFYTTTPAATSDIAPEGAYHSNISYYASDGITLVLNSGNYTSNGCARGIALNAWALNVKTCIYSGGPNVVYVRVTFSGSNANFASPDLKIKKPSITARD